MSDMLFDNPNQPKSYDSLLFDEVNKIDGDQDYWFKLRGDNVNPLVDAATPLIGMALRVRRLSSCDNVHDIYKQAVEEVKAIEVELTEAGYEHAVMLAYRYVLCSFIDEAVMSTTWGADSVWAEHSLLTRFHNETWGGEKVFTILTRLEGEPKRYKALLEFIFLCFCLGFEGRYKVMSNGREEYDKVIANLYEILRRLEEKEPEELTSATDHVMTTKYSLSRQIPLWVVFSGFFTAWIVVFIGYSVALHNKSTNVLEQLNQILQ
jgi:type VI secretion system protein ImpK